MPGQPYPSYPEADRASPEYAYVDPKNAWYDLAKLPREYHPLDAWKLLGKNDVDEKLHGKYYQTIGAVVSAFSVVIYHSAVKKPLWSNLPRYVIATGIGIVLGEATYRKSRSRAQIRDAMIQEYMESHYHEFPMIKRVKYGEVFLPWRAIR